MWRQVRFLKDKLRVLCGQGRTLGGQQRSFQDWMKTADHTTEFLWARVRLKLPKKSKTQPSSGNVLVLGGARLPEEANQMLKKGPNWLVKRSVGLALLARLRLSGGRMRTGTRAPLSC
ncbi:hypothetical protein HPB52_003165 [Rhipicephalus sanguineus]|uniref:Uncharacterized protein n=1 Tax=Rhipicephalus sanguineus TaxID=34632 RepID=A0A9D4QD18_RHISA|nr:hypothetical protein HPB52_003165 [Rhipicephalus sanguineus]